MKSRTLLDHLKVIGAAFAVTLAVCVASITVVIPRLIDGASLTVLTGSMEPAIPAGSMVIVKPIDPEDVRVGDVITYQAEPDSPSLISHRVTAIGFEDEERTFTTKGDANEAEDLHPVRAGAIRGQVVFHVPHLGTISDFVRTPLGLLLLIGLPVAVYAYSERRQGDDNPSEEPSETEPAAPPAAAHPLVARPLSGPTAGTATTRELLLVRVAADPAGRRDLIVLTKAFGGDLVDVSMGHVTVELTADPAVLDEFEVLLGTWPRRSVRRSGALSLPPATLILPRPHTTCPSVSYGVVSFAPEDAARPSRLQVDA